MVGTGKTSTGVNYLGTHNAYSRVDISNSYIKGLKIGVTFSQSGGCHFYNNLAEENETPYKIGTLSMFLYWEKCTNNSNKYFIYCNVAASGGVSNGIMIYECTSTNSTAEDLYITENQTVFVDKSSFTGGKGGEASIYFYNCCDLRVTNTTITSNSSSRSGIMLKGNNARGIYENNNISNCNYGMYINDNGSQRITTLVYSNTFNNKTGDIYLMSSIKDLKIYKNTFNTSAAQPISGNSTTKNNVLICQNTFKCNSYDIAAVAHLSNSIVGNNNYANGNH